jgi:hypothetical protein
MIDDGVCRLQPVGRIGARRTDRIFMDAVRYRAGQLKKSRKTAAEKTATTTTGRTGCWCEEITLQLT